MFLMLGWYFKFYNNIIKNKSPAFRTYDSVVQLKPVTSFMIFENYLSHYLICTYATVSLGLLTCLECNMCMYCVFQNCLLVNNYFNFMHVRMNLFLTLYIYARLHSFMRIKYNKSYSSDKQIRWLKRHRVYTSVE